MPGDLKQIAGNVPAGLRDAFNASCKSLGQKAQDVVARVAIEVIIASLKDKYLTAEVFAQIEAGFDPDTRVQLERGYGLVDEIGELAKALVAAKKRVKG